MFWIIIILTIGLGFSIDPALGQLALLALIAGLIAYKVLGWIIKGLWSLDKYY